MWLIDAFHLDRILVPRFNWVDNSILVQEFPVSSNSSLVLKVQKVFQQSDEKLSTLCLFVLLRGQTSTPAHAKLAVETA